MTRQTLKEKVLFLIENADNDTYVKMLDWAFGNSLVDMIMEKVEMGDNQEYKDFIKEFSKKEVNKK